MYVTFTGMFVTKTSKVLSLVSRHLTSQAVHTVTETLLQFVTSKQAKITEVLKLMFQAANSKMLVM